MKKFGADVGNDTLKLAWVNEKGEIETLEVMNIISQATKRRSLKEEVKNPLNLLDVTVSELINSKEKKLGRYFVGGLSYKESKGDYLERSELDVKGESTETIIMLVTGLAYALYDPQIPQKTEEIALGSSLPTEEFFDDNILKSFEGKLINKKYIVQFNDSYFKGAKITINFVKTEIQTEGTAPEIAYTCDLNGEYKNEMKNVDQEVHLSINIGSITTEMAVFNQGEFDSKGFKGIPIGTSKPLDKIIEELSDIGVSGISRHKLDYIIRQNEKLTAYVNNDVKDITNNLKEFKEDAFSYFTMLLVNRINMVLSNAGINPSLVDKVNMSGGGTLTFFSQFKNKFKRAKIEKIDNPRFAAAIGNLIIINSASNADEAATDEALK